MCTSKYLKNRPVKTHFTPRGVFGIIRLRMRTIKKVLPLWLLTLLLAGCSSTITNLTPGHQARNPTGLYHFGAAFDTSQQSLQQKTLKAYVVMGFDMYPMQQTPLVKNRWETVAPVPASQDIVLYRFKFEYEYLSIPQRKADSKLSPTYQLKIQEK